MKTKRTNSQNGFINGNLISNKITKVKCGLIKGNLITAKFMFF